MRARRLYLIRLRNVSANTLSSDLRQWMQVLYNSVEVSHIREHSTRSEDRDSFCYSRSRSYAEYVQLLSVNLSL